MIWLILNVQSVQLLIAFNFVLHNIVSKIPIIYVDFTRRILIFHEHK